MILNDIANKITSFLPKQKVKVVERHIPDVRHPIVKSYFADRLRQLEITVPVSDWDEGYNQALDDAIQKLMQP